MTIRPYIPTIEQLLGDDRRLETQRAAAAGPRNGSETANEVTQLHAAIYHDRDELLGDVSPLDLPLTFTRFPNVKARNLSTDTLSLRTLASVISRMRAKEKSALPLLKLGTFGQIKTASGSLRHDANLLRVSGIEGDYDDGAMTPQEASTRLKEAGVAALVYTTPSHTSDAPRWRVLAPLSESVSPADRDTLCARLNGALGGVLASESFTRSQTYYFGGIGSDPSVYLVEGRHLDKAADVQPIGKTARLAAASLFADILGDVEPCDAPVSTTETPPLGYTAARAADCLCHIPNGSRDYLGWLSVAASLRHESWGRSKSEVAEFCRVFVEWSRTSTKHFLKHADQRTADAAAQKVFHDLKRETGAARTMRSLASEAKANGWSDIQFDDLESEFEDQPEAPQKAVSKSTLSFLTPSDCDAAPSRAYIMKGLLAEQDVACIFGAPGAGKSLLAPFLAYALAQGRHAFGMRSKAGGVFYVAAEDPHGMRGRVKALRIAHGDAEGFQLVEGVSDLLAKDSPDLAALRQAVKDQKPKLVILDTLAMSFPGLEENSAEAMGRVVAVARALTKWGAAVILIHHDTKAEGATPRGHSLLNGALDVALHVKRDDSGVIRGKLTKNRNGSCDRDIAFRIATEDGGTDEDGDRITLPRCDELTDDFADVPKLNVSERAVVQCVKQLLDNAGLDADFAGDPAPISISERVLREFCTSNSPDKPGHLVVSEAPSRESRVRAYRRALDSLVGQAVLSGFSDPVSGDRLISLNEIRAFGGVSMEAGHSRTSPDKSQMSGQCSGGGSPDRHGHPPIRVSSCPAPTSTRTKEEDKDDL